ncbi:MAG: universal stress protein [Burkholderiaceae bacterium]|jgi:nucleotide-binding universal stress UspA family protein
MKILVAIDGSENALRALQKVVDYRDRFTSPLSLGLMNVHDNTSLKHAARVLGAQAVRDYVHDQAEHQLAPALRLVEDRGVDHQKIIATGPVAPTLIEEAQTQGYDMIALGARGSGALQDWLMGSVAQRVSATSPVPVLLVP